MSKTIYSIPCTNNQCPVVFRTDDKRRKYCCQSCSSSMPGRKLSTRKQSVSLKEFYRLKKAKTIADWQSGLISGTTKSGMLVQTIDEYVRRKFNYACTKCGWKEIHPIHGNVPTQLEHIDGNFLNNKEENLTLLCPNCHSLTSTFGALNKNGRRKYFKNKVVLAVER